MKQEINFRPDSLARIEQANEIVDEYLACVLSRRSET